MSCCRFVFTSPNLNPVNLTPVASFNSMGCRRPDTGQWFFVQLTQDGCIAGCVTSLFFILRCTSFQILCHSLLSTYSHNHRGHHPIWYQPCPTIQAQNHHHRQHQSPPALRRHRQPQKPTQSKLVPRRLRMNTFPMKWTPKSVT